MPFNPDFTFPATESARSLWFVFHEGRLFIKAADTDQLIPRNRDLVNLDIAPIHKQYLGTLDGLPCYAAELSYNRNLPDGFEFESLRRLFGRLGEEFNLMRRLLSERNVQLVQISAAGVSPLRTCTRTSGRPGSATIAFTVSYQGQNAKQVAQVANVLTSLYMEENLKNREEKARTTFEFLEAQLEELGSEVLRLEAEIADFKDEHVHELPELRLVVGGHVQTLHAAGLPASSSWKGALPLCGLWCSGC